MCRRWCISYITADEATNGWAWVFLGAAVAPVADAVETAGAPVADPVLTEACNRAVLKLTELSNIFWTFCIKTHAINVNSNKENQINNYFGYQMWYY